MKQIKHNLKFIISIAILIMVTFITNCYLVKADETKNPSINSTITFYGNMSNEKGIILKWSKVPKSKGYVIYRNNKKIATIKSNKIKSYTDKKVKAGKKYAYQIAPYMEVKGKKVLGVKSYKIRVKATKRNAKKINPARVVIPDFYYEDNYNVGLYESIKLHAKARVNKGLKKKKVYNSNLVWSSSDESLATVNQKGVVTANDNRKTGTVYITARAVNGVKKVIKVDVMDYMNVFQTTWSILKLNSDGTTQSFKTSACVGSDAETNQIGKTNFSFEKGETRTLTLYYILSDEEVENDKLVISFSLKNSPFIGPLAIVHEP